MASANQQIRREWLDWSAPCLPQAAAWLTGQMSREGWCDGRRAVCIVPGARAGRNLLGFLLQACRESGLSLIPPRILTPGQLVEALVEAGEAIATIHEQTWSWLEELRSAGAPELRRLLPEPPDRADILAWHELARLLIRLHAELSGEGLSFEDAARKAEIMDQPAEADRWRAAAALQRGYESRLTEAGLADPASSHWRRIAGQRRAADVERVVLIGVDLNLMQRRALALHGERCTALVHAPGDGELADRFDADGCVIPGAWENAPLEIDDEQIVVADRPEDQAQAALRALGSLAGAYSTGQITVGLGDETLTGALERAGGWAGVGLHSAAGRGLGSTAPARLLAAMAQWLEEPRFAHLAGLLRHPDLEQWIDQTLPSEVDAGPATQSWLTLLDRYFTDHLAGRVTDSWLGAGPGRDRLKAIHDGIARLLEPLNGPARPLTQWCAPLMAVLGRIHCPSDSSALAGAELDVKSSDGGDFAGLGACEAIRDVLAEMSTTRPHLQPRVDAATALRLILAALDDVQLCNNPQADEIEMLGWLELHLDPAPALIITGVNDGMIPQSVTGDGFLPDSLRRALGLASNSRRYARDAYLLAATLKSRPHVTLICGRRDGMDDPLAPSRLLLACEDARLPDRVRRLCSTDAALRWPLPAGLREPAGAQQSGVGKQAVTSSPHHPIPSSFFTIPPPPGDLPALESIRVTAFKDYLACPYRFMLRHVLELNLLADDGCELDPMCFGTLAHDVLHAFASDRASAGSTDEEMIERFLIGALGREAERKFGARPLPAVRIQLAQLEWRLRGFASWQARSRAEGWAICESELAINDRNLLEVPGQAPIALRGQIDRIDRHERTGQWRIIDYKTGDKAKAPFDVHHDGGRAGGEWIDLQLPLYHRLARQRDMEGAIELGYVVLPRDPLEVGFLPGPWSEADLGGALEKAVEVVRGIRAGAFEHTSDFDARFDDFARICQTTTFGNRPAEADA